VRVPVPKAEGALLFTLIAQTLLLYGLMVGAIALIVSRITRPLAALTGRVEQFAAHQDTHGQLDPQGPDDMRRLIMAHNAMEDRIAAMLDEKDVMLGAIGHDLKTPLAALRVRIESVEDESERARMAATIEDITRSLDDILSLARVGRPTDPVEPTELGALVGQVAEEFEDLGEPVSFEPAARIVLPVRATWLRRAVRNLTVNALRYGKVARITLERADGQVRIRIEDDGPGIPEERMEAMFQPFARGEPSRNSLTGGAGLGLTLARAIADQHGGRLELANRRDASGAITGLTATIVLPPT
jgi:signal transduction histidine kinase